MAKVVLVAGFKDAGKTKAIAVLSRALVGRGRRVGTLKHVHGGALSLDRRGKDSRIHSEAGASPVVVVSGGAMAVFTRLGAGDPLAPALKLMRSSRVDYFFVEGFFDEFSRRRPLTVLCASSKKDADALAKSHSNIAFICGRFAERSRRKTYGGIPLLRLPRDMPTALRLLA